MSAGLIFGMTWEQIQDLQQKRDSRPVIHVCDCQDPTCAAHTGNRCIATARNEDPSGCWFCDSCMNDAQASSQDSNAQLDISQRFKDWTETGN